jgi:MscS family membrane protein
MLSFLLDVYYGNTLLDWLTALLLALGVVVLARAVYWFFKNWVKLLVRATRTRMDDVIIDLIEEPVVFLIVVFGTQWALGRLTLEKPFSEWFVSAYSLAAAIGFAWLISRFYRAFHDSHLVPLVRKSDTTLDDHLMPTLRSGLIIIIWTIGVVVGLNNAGWDVGALLAGLGIGGLAFALAAQDTVANFFGGVTIFLQKPFRVGDLIEFGGKTMTVKEIDLRATRLEDFDTGHAIYIPNSMFTNGMITNVSAEGGFWAARTLRLSPDTPAAKMEQALKLIEETVKNHPDVDRCLLRFNTFDNYSLEILLVYHIREFGDRWHVLTDVHLTLMRAFEENQIRLALPISVLDRRNFVDGQRIF